MPAEDGGIQSLPLPDGYHTLERTQASEDVFRLRYTPPPLPATNTALRIARARAERSEFPDGLEIVFAQKGRVFAGLKRELNVDTLHFTHSRGMVTDPETYPRRISFATIRYNTTQFSEIAPQSPLQKESDTQKLELVKRYIRREIRLQEAGLRLIGSSASEAEKPLFADDSAIVRQPNEELANRVAQSAVEILYATEAADIREAMTRILRTICAEPLDARSIRDPLVSLQEPIEDEDVVNFVLDRLYARLDKWARKFALRFAERDGEGVGGITWRDPRDITAASEFVPFDQEGIARIPVIVVGPVNAETAALSYEYRFRRGENMMHVSIYVDGEPQYTIGWRRVLNGQRAAQVLDPRIPPSDFSDFSGFASYSIEPLQLVA